MIMLRDENQQQHTHHTPIYAHAHTLTHTKWHVSHINETLLFTISFFFENESVLKILNRFQCDSLSFVFKGATSVVRSANKSWL